MILQSLRQHVEEESRKTAALKQEIQNIILALPDNTRIGRIGGSPNCFVISSRDLGDNWSVEHHDFSQQYRFICSEIDRRGVDSITAMLDEVVHNGVIYDNKSPRTRHTFHPDVRFAIGCLVQAASEWPRIKGKSSRKEKMQNQIEKVMAEQATGIYENPIGISMMWPGAINRKGLVTRGGPDPFNNHQEARDYLLEGGEVDVPAAGAGSYHEVFRALGFTQVEAFCTSSSAGDWNFALFDGVNWYPGFQSNRYPRHGFSYSFDWSWCFESKQDLLDFMAEGG